MHVTEQVRRERELCRFLYVYIDMYMEGEKEL